MQIKKKPRKMIPFDRHKYAALYYDGDREKFVCVIGYNPLENEAAYSCKEEIAFDNPLEAVTRYEGTFHPGIRIRFGDWLERLGYHRYSGEKQRQKEE